MGKGPAKNQRLTVLMMSVVGDLLTNGGKVRPTTLLFLLAAFAYLLYLSTKVRLRKNQKNWWW